jgi:hypothetical protein
MEIRSQQLDLLQRLKGHQDRLGFSHMSLVARGRLYVLTNVSIPCGLDSNVG